MTDLLELSSKYNIEQLYSHIVLTFLNNKNINLADILNNEIKSFISNIEINKELLNYIANNKKLFSLKALETLYFSQIDSEVKTNNGIVYTPEYIVDYIINNTIVFDQSIINKKILDPSCGCSIFLLRVIENVSKIENIDLIKFVENNIFGIDMDSGAIHQTKLLINLLLLSLGYNTENLKINIVRADSLVTDWSELFNLSTKFDYIIGNPPYIKVQSLDKKYLNYLTSTFKTMESGGVNIFYAFIEKSTQSINYDGNICFILPNNFLKIKAAMNLRHFLEVNDLVDTILDFDCNMLFAPIMTYNCILKLNYKKKASFYYSIIKKTESIIDRLNDIKFSNLSKSILKKESWIFHEDDVQNKIKMIERFDIKLGDYIRTGIATLRDALYLVEKNNSEFCKTINGQTFEIEKDILKPIYKVSNIKDKNVDNYVSYIIYPYYRNNDKAIPIPEKELELRFPKTYRYLLSIKDLLSERASDKNMLYWYQYGRSQGINNFGEKLLYPQFLKTPKFIHCENPNSLFCNGFAISSNEKISLTLLQKILCSSVLEFYVSQTSYTIDGGFYCYQKKYLQKFSIPNFSKEEKNFLLDCADKKILDTFLEDKYFAANN